MKITPDSPELTAYVLGELSPDQRAEVEAAVATSPELAEEVATLGQTARSMEAWLAAPGVVPALDPMRRAEILAAASASAEALGHVDANPFRQGATLQPGREAAGWRVMFAWAWTRLRQPIAALAVATVAIAAVAWVFFLRPGKTEMQVASTGLRYQHPSEPGPRKREPARATGRPAAKDKVAEARPAPGPVVAAAPPAVAPSTPPPAPSSSADRPAGRAVVKAQSSARKMADEPRRERHADRAKTSDPVPVASAVAPASSAAPAPTGPRLANRYGLGVETDERKAMAPRSWAGSAGVALPDTNERREAIGYFDRAPGEGYAAVAENDFLRVAHAPLSTFGLDVDTASYANVRRFLREGSLPPRDAVRVEEMVNYFRYAYPAPRGDDPVSLSVEVTASPWREGFKLVRLGIHARPVERRERPSANLVFLIDVSGSMAPENKLPMVKGALRLLLDRLDARDRVALVTYAAGSDVLAEPTPVDGAGKARLTRLIEGLQAGNGTHGSAGIEAAYALAGRHLQRERVNRVVLCTDGDFNIGKTGHDDLMELITSRARSGVFLTVLGFGMGNYQDATMELLADKGNGQYAYIDSFREARKVLGEELEGTLVTVAKDVKAQVEFNPARARSYRLVGYENRALQDRDFHDDTKDGGELGAGHQVTVLYEVEPTTAGPGVGPLRYQRGSGPEEDAPAPRLKPGHEDELLTVKIRYKQPDADVSRMLEVPVKDADKPLAEAGTDVRFAVAVASHAMLLRGSPHRGSITWETVLRMAQQGMGPDPEGYRAEFVDLVRRSMQLRR